ncbi:MAG TPA: barstar family protein [Nonomuraea sp.]|nr:barstar family protein [Nonomuraea sp.]
MSAERPWVRHELPWLRSGPLFRVHRTALTDLGEFLDRFSYRRITLDGRRMTSRMTAHDEIARAFGFPDYYGKNWDAFNDCFGDFVEAHDGGLIAVIWDHVAAAAAVAPATTIEVGWALLESHFGSMPTFAPGTPLRISMDVFALGEGEDFDRPADE